MGLAHVLMGKPPVERSLVFLILSLAMTVPSFGNAAGLSFHDWKFRRIQEAQSVVRQLQHDKSLQREEKESRVSRASAKLVAEKDLSPNDYFHLYLIDLYKKSPNEAKQAACKLTKEETAEILLGYVRLAEQVKELGSPRHSDVALLFPAHPSSQTEGTASSNPQ